MVMWTEFSKGPVEWTINQQLLHEAEQALMMCSLKEPNYEKDFLLVPLFELVANKYGEYTTINEIK